MKKKQNSKETDEQRIDKQRNRQSGRQAEKQTNKKAENIQAKKQVSRKAACLKCPESKTGVCDNMRNAVLHSRKPREYGVLREENR